MKKSFVVILLPAVAALTGLGMLHVIVPDYLTLQGFPLDDAWIHAVYARELSRTGLLAYNPGLPATGETSPLWAVILSVPHHLGDVSTVVAAAKIVGFALHAASAALIALVVLSSGGSKWLAVLAGSIVGLHPDLIAASVSGMEVPLATLAGGFVAYATVRRSARLAAIAGTVAFLARPETAVFAVLLPLVYSMRCGYQKCLPITGAALAGSVAALVCVAIRNTMVSGMPLPATFYAKTNLSSPISVAWQHVGFTQVFASMPVVGVPAILAAIATVSTLVLIRAQTSEPAHLGAALALSGLAFCAVSFSLVRPLDPPTFYHQRYVLPAVAPILAAIPLLTFELSARRTGYAVLVRSVVIVLILVSLVTMAPSRFRRLSNDARNIDDVQVAFGRALSHAQPSESAWVADAGATRYFGAPFIVDLMALNTPELLTADAQAFLDRHPPRYLDAFSNWSVITLADGGDAPRQSFSPSTPYTVTSFSSMGYHALVSCEPPGRRGVVTVRQRAFSFRCAGQELSRR
jgi:hypothetical protein